AERLDRLDRAEDAECTVKPAAFRYRVQMRPHENDLAFAAESREEIRGGVAPHVRASLGLPRADEIARSLLVGRETQTRHGRILAADPRERGHPAFEALSADHR